MESTGVTDTFLATFTPYAWHEYSWEAFYMF